MKRLLISVCLTFLTLTSAFAADNVLANPRSMAFPPARL